MNETLASLVVNVEIGGWIISKLSKTALGEAIASKIGSKFSTKIKNAAVTIKDWVLDKASTSGLKEKLANRIGNISCKVKNVVTSVKNWALGKINIKGLKDKILDKIGSIKINMPKTDVTVKEVVPQIGENINKKSFIEAIKSALGLEKGIALANIVAKIGSISIAGISMATSPAADELVRRIDEWFTKVLEKTPGYDTNLGIFNLPKKLLVDFPVAIGDFVFNNEDGATHKTLQEAFNKFMTGGDGGTPSITALVKYLTDTSEVDKTNKKLSKTKRKIKVTFESITSKNWASKYKEYRNLKNKTATTSLKVKYLNRESAALAQNLLLTNSARAKQINKTVSLSLKMNGKKVSTNDIKNLAALVTDPSFMKNNPYNLRLSKKAGGGIFANGTWHNIAKYASGGMPNMGQLFVAREKGPELVSTLKGHTAVMNNDQIVASVSQGVSDAVYNVMTPVLTSLVTSINRMNSSGTPLYVEGVSEGDIVKITQNANADYKKRYGKPLFT